MDELEKVIYEAMKDGFSENEFYSVKLIGKRTKDRFIVNKIKIKFKKSGGSLTGVIQSLYIPSSVCSMH